MKTILVIWCDIPEETHFVILDRLNDSEFETIKQFHNHFINENTDSRKQEKLLDEMSKFFYHDDTEFRFTKHNEMQSGSFDAIIICGFIL
jgi:hypothetical protein